jgi:hypothetical protein
MGQLGQWLQHRHFVALFPEKAVGQLGQSTILPRAHGTMGTASTSYIIPGNPAFIISGPDLFGAGKIIQSAAG